ncbi:LysR family transcriptional regulator [Brevibacillus fluminis]|uniref:LysR family transcriptional regulator n=1 Tax=Brevibacillus fluminis TaxID=511487 RepID=UPI003F88E9CF
MNLDQIESFLCVASTGSFSKAGEFLYLTQPSVSSRVQSLETVLGTVLFERSGKIVVLTEEGKAFLPYAEKVMQHMNDGRLVLQQMKNAVEGELRFCSVMTAANHLLPTLLADFHRRYPKVRLIVHTGHSHQVVDMVLNCEVPFGISRNVDHPQIENRHLMSDEMLLVVHPDHPLSKLDVVTPEQIAAEPFILFNRGSQDWILVKEAFDKQGLTLNIVMEVDNFVLVKQMIKARVGIAFLSQYAVKDEVASGQLKTIAIAGMPKIKRNFEIIALKNRKTTGIAHLFKEFLLSHADE